MMSPTRYGGHHIVKGKTPHIIRVAIVSKVLSIAQTEYVLDEVDRCSSENRSSKLGRNKVRIAMGSGARPNNQLVADFESTRVKIWTHRSSVAVELSLSTT